MFEKLEKLALRFAEIEELLGTPEVASNPDRTSKLAKERADLQPVVAAYRQLRATQSELEDAKALANDQDEDLASMAREEMPALEAKVSELEEQLKVTLLPKDPNDDKNAIVEVRAGTGGDEAGLFAGELFRMYQRFALRHGLTVELVDSNGSEQGGFKEVVFEVNGPEAYRLLKNEGGVHRVQRVPVTEAQGRVHTSTATVVVLPEADEYEFEVDPNDLRIDIFHSGGAGGQNVNKVATAVELRFDVTNSSLAPETKARLIEQLGSRISGDGVLIIDSREHRTQGRNRAAARSRLAELLAQASRRPTPRRPTKPGRAAGVRRLDGKRRRSEVKALRGRPQGDD